MLRENADSGNDAWSAFIEGKENAFHHLYRLHYVGLINYCSRLTGSRESANDFVIEMLLNLWEKRDRLPMVNNVRSYLLSCVRATVLQHLRSEKRRMNREIELSLDANPEISYEDYLTNAQTESDLKIRLANALIKLTPRQKELLELKFVYNLDYNEIAQQCGITKRTAYNIVFDALTLLKKDFERDKKGNPDHYFPLIAALLSLLYRS